MNANLFHDVWTVAKSYETGSSMEGTRRTVYAAKFCRTWIDNGCNGRLCDSREEAEALADQLNNK